MSLHYTGQLKNSIVFLFGCNEQMHNMEGFYESEIWISLFYLIFLR